MESALIGFCNLFVTLGTQRQVIRWPFDEAFVRIFLRLSFLVAFMARGTTLLEMDIFGDQVLVHQESFIHLFRRN
jgi:hypothetical protein